MTLPLIVLFRIGHILGQLTYEAALKMLVLYAGQVVTIHDSSLGFRNGPKSILNELFMSRVTYTKRL
ncbi:hypothetical protein [Peribacillus frigoritolerans]|uniref:hypothetical protein n=1 Tax=Peribacillus frigoritolerans TaxID=450367 RepID=UPI0032E3944A